MILIALHWASDNPLYSVILNQRLVEPSLPPKQFCVLGYFHNHTWLVSFKNNNYNIRSDIKHFKTYISL